MQNSDTPPSTPPASTGGPNPRYVYLVQRLRGRQITMEEATELFGIMDGMVRIAEARMAAAIVAAGGRPAAPTPPPKRAPSVASPFPGDDLLWLTILGAGAGAGVLAAIAKRAGESVSGTPLVQNATKPTPPS